MSYNFGDARGTFMGAHFDLEDPLILTKNILRNYVQGLLHLAHSKNLVCYNRWISINEFLSENSELLVEIRKKFKAAHKYNLTDDVLRAGINDFMERMNHIATR